MMAKKLQVGIIGASADRGWAKISHVPAVRKLEGLELGAVVSGSLAKSQTAAKAFGARAGYADAEGLFRDPEIDIVSICVKAPEHRELVLGALAAGKHIYCEWPLGRNSAESEELAAAAEAAGAHVAIGLQARMNGAARRARDLIASGAIGRPLSARVLSTTAAFGPKVEEAMAFAENAESGVTLVTIQGAHTLDLAIAVLGAFADVSALATTQYPELEVVAGKSAVRQARTTPDQLFTHSRMANGSALSVAVLGGRGPKAITFRMEVVGETGELALEGGALRGFQSGRLHLVLKGQTLPVDDKGMGSMQETAVNVAAVYAGLRDDILSGTFTVPGFGHAVRLNRLMDDVMSSSETGARKAAAGWPLS